MNADPSARVMRSTYARSARWALGLMTMWLFSACTWGVKASDIAWSRGPRGAPADVRLAESRLLISGELLAVDSAGVLLQTIPAADSSASLRVSRVPWTAIRTLSLPGLGSKYSVWGGAPPSLAILQQFALVSHFPQGLEPEVLAKLLSSMNQTVVEEVR